MVSSDNGEVLGEAEVERPAEETRALVSVEDGRLSSNDDVKLRRRHRQLEAVDPDEQAFFGGYCGGKAEVLIEKGVEQYRAEDFFDMPSVEFSDEQLAAVLSGCDQMVAGRGFSMETPLEGISVTGCYALIATLHFKVVGRQTHRPGPGFLDEMRCQQGKRIVGSLFNRVVYSREY